MTDANTICHDVDLLGDWLDSRGFTEEAGLCLRVLGLIHEQAEENEKLRAALAFYADKDTWRSSTSYMCGHIGETRASMDKGEKARAAAAALKETGDE